MSPETMVRALTVHNNVIRGCISDHDGYEVKTGAVAHCVCGGVCCPVLVVSRKSEIRPGVLITMRPPVRSEGDAFMVAFANPRKAIDCAIDIQHR